MNIEVKQPNGAYIAASVLSVTPETLLVTFKNESRPDEYVPYEDCRVVRKSGAQKQALAVGSIVEACIKVKNGDAPGWQKVKIRDIKGSFVVVEGADSPDFVDIISIDGCRQLDATYMLTFDKIKHYTFQINEGVDYFSSEDSFSDLVDSVGDILVQFDKASATINVWGLSEAQIRRVKAMANIFLENSRQKMSLLQRREMAKKSLEKACTTKDGYVEEFTVHADLMGLSIGAQGSNYNRTSKIDGVKSISYTLSSEFNDLYNFKVVADNPEAAEQARSQLEFVVKTIPVPHGMEIVDKSTVVRVQIGEDSCETDKKNGEVSFIFTGTNEAVQHAELLIHYQLKHLKEMQGLRQQIPLVSTNYFRVDAGDNVVRLLGGMHNGRMENLNNTSRNSNEFPLRRRRANYANHGNRAVNKVQSLHY